MFMLCYWFDQKTRIAYLVVIILFKVEFGHAQISLPKIVTPISKTACIKPRKQIYVGFWYLYQH